MADISYELQRIMQAVYGEEVRGSIHDAIDKINQVGEVVLSEGTAVTSPTSPTTGFFDGSFYFNTQTSDLWKCTGTGWLLVGNLEGAGIVSIVKTGTSGLVDTYTVTLTNGNTSTFDVTNGYSPTVTIGTKVGRDQPVTFTDKDGSETIHIMDGQDGTASTLASLTDVDISSPVNRQILEYNGTTGNWENSDTLKDTQDIIAPVEESTTASQAYSAGDELIFNDILYKAISAIAQGDDLIPSGTGQNIDLAGTIVSQLKAKFDEIQENISKPNLLDNGWFTVNQRGASSYTASGYTVDRWYSGVGSGGSGTYTPLSGGGIRVERTGPAYTFQKIEGNFEKRFAGKTLTFSLLVSFNGVDTIYSTTATIPNITPTEETYWGYVKKPFGYMMMSYAPGNFFRVLWNNEERESTYSSYVVKAAKLEVGSRSTLGMDTVPNYEEELLKCQRHFYVLMGDPTNNMYINTCAMVDTNLNIDFEIPLPCKMRAEPTVTFSNTDMFGYTEAGAADMTPFTSIQHGYTGTPSETGILIIRGKRSGLTAGKIYKIGIKANTKAYVSADL